MEVQRIIDVPNGMFAKILPVGCYALFTHHFRDGGFSQAFKSVYNWEVAVAADPVVAQTSAHTAERIHLFFMTISSP